MTDTVAASGPPRTTGSGTRLHQHLLGLYAITTLAPVGIVWFVAGTRLAAVILACVAITVVYAIRTAIAASRKHVGGAAVTTIACALIVVSFSGCWIAGASHDRFDSSDFRKLNRHWSEAIDRSERGGDFETALGVEGRELWDRYNRVIVQGMFNATLFQYALVCAAWGVCCGAGRIDRYAVLRDVRSRTYFALVTISFGFAIFIITLKLIGQQLQNSFTHLLENQLLVALVHALRSPVLNDELAGFIYRSAGQALTAEEVKAAKVTAISVFELVLLANALLYYGFEKYGGSLLRPFAFRNSRLAVIRRGSVRLGIGLLAATSAFAAMLTVRRLVFVILNWPTDIRFFL